MVDQEQFDSLIGRLDRVLSEFLLSHVPNGSLDDEANRATLKHHAEDLIGVGEAMLKKLAEGR